MARTVVFLEVEQYFLFLKKLSTTKNSPRLECKKKKQPALSLMSVRKTGSVKSFFFCKLTGEMPSSTGLVCYE